jgi:hypothetical protein
MEGGSECGIELIMGIDPAGHQHVGSEQFVRAGLSGRA